MYLLTACNSATDKDKVTTTTTADGKEVTSEEAKEERNKETALASMRDLMKGNVDSAMSNVTPDAVDYGDGSMEPIKSRDSVVKMMKMWMAAVPDYKGDDLTAVADGNKVMVHGVWSGTWKGDLMGMKATGKSFKVNDVDIFTFNDEGKITEHRNVQSMNEVARQIGMSMPPQKKK
jgi:predicted ester cyclase